MGNNAHVLRSPFLTNSIRKISNLKVRECRHKSDVYGKKDEDPCELL
jgi:hypothetical protein